jgi:hypothetical protein
MNELKTHPTLYSFSGKLVTPKILKLSELANILHELAIF